MMVATVIDCSTTQRRGLISALSCMPHALPGTGQALVTLHQQKSDHACVKFDIFVECPPLNVASSQELMRLLAPPR